MAVSQLSIQQNLVLVNITEFPPCEFNPKRPVAIQIAEHLKRILIMHETGLSTFLSLPSTLTLSQFYKHSILDVLDGLFELKKQHYDYMMNGLDGEILLQDPLCRQTPNKVMRLLWHEILYPRYLFHKARERR